VRTKWVRRVVAFAICGGLLAACGSSSKAAKTSDPGASAATTAAGAASSAAATPKAGVALAKERTEALFAGTYTNPPTDSPPRAADKLVWIISYLQAYPASANLAAGAKDGADKMGWKSNIFDAEGDPSTAVNGIRQAIAAKANAIIVIFLDCDSLKAGIEEAKAAKILVVNAEAADCATPLVDHVVGYNAGFYSWNDGKFESFVAAWQAMGADYITAKTGGKAKIIQFRQTDTAITNLQADGFKRELTEVCPDCTLTDVNWVGTEMGPALQQKAEQALLKNPDLNAIVVPADAALTGGVMAALEASGRSQKIIIVGGEGTNEVLEIVRSRPAGTHAVMALPVEWDAYTAIDTLNRLFNGRKPSTAPGEGLQLVDLEHGLPAAGQKYVPLRDGKPVDFAALYAQAWATGK
jgi:ribose transport system substrate-binding protein